MPPTTVSRRDLKLTPETAALVTDYFDLAMRIAWDFYRSLPPGAHHHDDLISTAQWALVDAALRWRPYCQENGYDAENRDPNGVDFFNTFCQRSVRGALHDYCRAEDYVSREVRDLFREATALLNQGKTREDVIAHLGITDKKMTRVMASVAAPPVCMIDLSAGTIMKEVELATEASYLLSRFADIIDSLPRRSRLVLALRYYVGIDIEGIAEALGVPVSVAQKAHTESIIEIRSRMELIATGV